MKKSILSVKLLIMTTLLFVGCSNDNDSNCTNDLTGELSTTETELVGSWVFIGMETEQEIDLTDDDMDNPSTNIYDQLEDCQQDIVYTFEDDRSYNFKQGYTAANCTNKVELNGTWKLTDGVLTFVANCSMDSVAIEFNDAKTEFTFEQTYKFVDIDGVTITTKVTFTYGIMVNES